MRLTREEVEGITASVAGFLGAHGASLYLYGSRADDRLKGGDIDLLLCCRGPRAAAALAPRKPAILVAIKEAIGDRRVDLSILEEEQVRSDPFYSSVMPKAVLLKEWG